MHAGLEHLLAPESSSPFHVPWNNSGAARITKWGHKGDLNLQSLENLRSSAFAKPQRKGFDKSGCFWKTICKEAECFLLPLTFLKLLT